MTHRANLACSHTPTAVIEKLPAASVLAICTVLLVRLLLGRRLRYRFDAAARRMFDTCRRVGLACMRWRSSRKNAARTAEEAIKRARGGSWDGNVYKPKSFRRPRKPH